MPRCSWTPAAGRNAAGHIAGATSLPFDEVWRDERRLRAFDNRGLPLVVYCGGGECESSKNLAWALLEAGQRRVLVFTGGVPEWQAAGYPMATGAEVGR